jgi:osmotically-inducible protein OsmY
MLYEKIARKTEGVVEVENEIRVIPTVLHADAAIERKVKEIVQTYSRFQGVSISVTVKTGAVNVLITLNHPADVLF